MCCSFPCFIMEVVMRLAWFKNPDNVVYADVDEFAENFGKETGISDLRGEIEKFREAPVPEGIILKGKKRSSIKLFIPNMYFAQPIEMGDTVWVYKGENYESYCLYWKE